MSEERLLSKREVVMSVGTDDVELLARSVLGWLRVEATRVDGVMETPERIEDTVEVVAHERAAAAQGVVTAAKAGNYQPLARYAEVRKTILLDKSMPREFKEHLLVIDFGTAWADARAVGGFWERVERWAREQQG